MKNFFKGLKNKFKFSQILRRKKQGLPSDISSSLPSTLPLELEDEESLKDSPSFDDLHSNEKDNIFDLKDSYPYEQNTTQEQTEIIKGPSNHSLLDPHGKTLENYNPSFNIDRSDQQEKNSSHPPSDQDKTYVYDDRKTGDDSLFENSNSGTQVLENIVQFENNHQENEAHSDQETFVFVKDDQSASAKNSDSNQDQTNFNETFEHADFLTVEKTKTAFWKKGFFKNKFFKKDIISDNLKDRLKKVEIQKLQKLGEGLFDPHARPSVHKVFLILLVACGLYSIGKISSLSLGFLLIPKKASPRPKIFSSTKSSMNTQIFKDEMKLFAEVNVFQTISRTKAPVIQPKGDMNALCAKAERETSLPIKLMGTTVLQDSVKSLASVTVRGAKDPIHVRSGDKIETMAKVSIVEKLYMVFRNLENGQCEFVKNEETKPKQESKMIIHGPDKSRQILANKSNKNGIQNEGNKFKITKGKRDDILNNISDVVTQARAIPITNPDGSKSFKLVEIVPGSVYTDLNLQNNDIITMIDGNKIQSEMEVLQLFNRIKSIDKLSLTVERNGIQETMEYSFD